MWIQCQDCGLIVGCSQDNGKTCTFCDNCLLSEQCARDIELCQQANIAITFILAKWDKGCMGHLVERIDYEN